MIERLSVKSLQSKNQQAESLLQCVLIIKFLSYFRHLKPDHHRKKCKTSVKWRTLNPIYNEEFCFETRPNEMDKQMLVITVWDKDIGKSDDFLGSLIIGHNSKGTRLQQWKGTQLFFQTFSVLTQFFINRLCSFT